MNIDNSAVQVFEGFLGVGLPVSYAEFLKKNDGDPPDKGRFEIPGEGDDVIQYFFPLISKNKTLTLPYKIKIFDGRIPDGMLPIGSDPGGNLILMCLKGKNREKIYFWDHEKENGNETMLIELAKDFSSFLKNLEL
jgi:hypothetical protein